MHEAKNKDEYPLWKYNINIPKNRESIDCIGCPICFYIKCAGFKTTRNAQKAQKTYVCWTCQNGNKNITISKEEGDNVPSS